MACRGHHAVVWLVLHALQLAFTEPRQLMRNVVAHDVRWEG